jgi:hypothetical protein
MKIKTLLIVLVAFSLSSFSQDYKPLLKEGSFWDVASWESAGLCLTSHTRYSIGDDVVINDKTYKKIVIQKLYGKEEQEGSICITKPYYTKENDGFNDLFEFVREDIEEKKVYVYASKFGQNQKEYTLYDFNLEVGDRIENSYTHNAILTNIEIDENGLKKFIFDSNSGNYFFYKEGVGSNFGLCDFNRTYIGSGKSLLCWGNNENQNNCGTTLNTENHELQSVKVFPNPVSDFLQIENIEDASIKIFSLNGRLLKKEKFKNEVNMNVANLKTGIYFIEISKSTNRKRLKIFKQ